jgi:hypothetical protein
LIFIQPQTPHSNNKEEKEAMTTGKKKVVVVGLGMVGIAFM